MTVGASWLVFAARAKASSHAMRDMMDGLPVPATALIWGLLSALSLPLGAMLGIVMSPVNPYIVANIIAFGAGCLMFAVTVELYGDQLAHLEEHKYEGTYEICICLVAAVAGSLIYISLNRWVENMEEAEEEEDRGETLTITKAIEQGKLHPSRADVEKGEKEPLVASSPEHTPRTAKARWSSVRAAKRMGLLKFKINLRHGSAKGGNANTLALGMLAGIIADGVPEAVLIGFLAAEGHLSFMFVASLFIANFPESFSSASLMNEHKAFPALQIIGLWTIPCVLTGGLAGLACYLIPAWAHSTLAVRILAAVIEGLAGGMMLAMIGSVMLPQAYNMAKENPPWTPWGQTKPAKNEHHGGDVPGVFCVCGFLTAVGLKVLGGALGSSH